MKQILFNTEMVRALIAGRKSATRRAPFQVPAGYDRSGGVVLEGERRPRAVFRNPDGDVLHIQAPYASGDILYVRETWARWSRTLGQAPRLYYRADGDAPVDIRWRPSIHMPKEAARLFLRVVKVYPQQLKDAGETDAKAEGFASRAELVAALLKMYPDCTEESWFWVNGFEQISKEEAMKGGGEE